MAAPYYFQNHHFNRYYVLLNIPQIGKNWEWYCVKMIEQDIHGTKFLACIYRFNPINIGLTWVFQSRTSKLYLCFWHVRCSCSCCGFDLNSYLYSMVWPEIAHLAYTCARDLKLGRYIESVNWNILWQIWLELEPQVKPYPYLGMHRIMLVVFSSSGCDAIRDFRLIYWPNAYL